MPLGLSWLEQENHSILPKPKSVLWPLPSHLPAVKRSLLVSTAQCESWSEEEANPSSSTLTMRPSIRKIWASGISRKSFLMKVR